MEREKIRVGGEIMSLSTKGLAIGLIVGLAIGLVLGYAITPKGADTSQLEQQISQLEGQVSSLQSQLNDKNTQIASLESQIASLQSQIEELEALVPPLRKGEWNLVDTFEGSSGLKTDYFYVAGTDLRISWTWTSSIEEFAGFGITLYREGQDIYVEMFFDLQEEGTTFAHSIRAANYYLDISAANLDQWTVAIEVFIPE